MSLSLYPSYLIILLAVALLLSCKSKSENKSISSDIDVIITEDGLSWMTTNLDIGSVRSYCGDNDQRVCDKYGRLYAWEAAIEGCASLGDGWRLPTDQEWQDLTRSYGGIYQDSVHDGSKAFNALIRDGKSGFEAILGGNISLLGRYEREGNHGMYWTATEADSTQAWFYNFAKMKTLINRHRGDKRMAFSVRCVQSK